MAVRTASKQVEFSMDYQATVLFITAYFLFVLWSFAYFKGQSNFEHRVFSWFIVGAFFWSLFLAIFYAASQTHVMQFWMKLTYTAAGFMPPALLLFSCVYPTGKCPYPFWQRALLFVPNVLLAAAFIPTDWLIYQATQMDGYKGCVLGSGHWLWHAVFYGMYCCALWRFFIRYRHYSGKVKDRLRYVLFGLLIGMTLTSITNIIMPVMTRFELIWIGPPATLVWIMYITQAMFRYRPRDYQDLAKRVVSYSLLFVVSAIVYFGSKYFCAVGVSSVMTCPVFLPTLVGSAMVVLFFIPMKNAVHLFLDRYLFGGSYFQAVSEIDSLRHELVKNERYKSLATIFSRTVLEIKDPLTTLKGYSQYLATRPDDVDFVKQFVGIMTKEIGRINHLLDHLIVHLRPAPISAHEVNMQELLNETIDMLKSNCVEHRITVMRAFKGNKDALLFIDATQIRQALLHVLINAIEAMPDGGQIWVAAEIDAHRKAYKVMIKDFGCGIPQEDFSQVFEPFFSLKDTHDGLGLFVAKSVIEDHNGTIDIRSDAGSGTEVTITIPLTPPA